MSSFARPTMNSAPSASRRARSPVLSQPSGVIDLGGRRRVAVVAAHDVGAAYPQLAHAPAGDVAPPARRCALRCRRSAAPPTCRRAARRAASATPSASTRSGRSRCAAGGRSGARPRASTRDRAASRRRRGSAGAAPRPRAPRRKAFEHARVHRGHALEDGDARARARRARARASKRGTTLAGRRPRTQRAEQHRGEPVDVVDRQRAVDAVAGPSSRRRGRRRAMKRRFACVSITPFGRAGGAGRVHDGRDSVGRRALAARCAGERPARRLRRSRPVGAEARRVRIDLGRDARAEQRTARRRVRADRRRARAAVSRGLTIDGAWRRSALAANSARDERDRVLADDRHAVAGRARRTARGPRASVLDRCRRARATPTRARARRIASSAGRSRAQRAASASMRSAGAIYCASRIIARAMTSCWICVVPS